MFYIYCLSDEVTAEMLEGARGVGGGEPRLIEFDGISAVVSEFAETSISVAREHVLAHERVVSRVLAHTTPLPFRFGTLAGQERLESYVASQKSSLKLALERVRGAVEMSVKIIWNVEEAGRKAAGHEAEAVANVAASAGAGTRFLLEKRRSIACDELLKERAEKLEKWLEKAVSDIVKESFVQVEPAEKLFLAASHLVLREKLDDYRARVEKARGEQPELHFLTSGPWAPYSFSSLFS